MIPFQWWNEKKYKFFADSDTIEIKFEHSHSRFIFIPET